MQVGEIYVGTIQAIRNRNTVHPMICIEDVPEGCEYFRACIISTDGPKEGRDNIPMKEEHFLEKDENGKPYKITYKNSHLIKTNYTKETKWINLSKQGKLSPIGIQFVLEKSPTFGVDIHSEKPIWKK